MRARGTIVLALLLTLGVCAPASAAPLSMAFTEARANVGKQLDDEALFEAPFTAPLGAQIDPGSGAITAGTLGVPDFETFITDPIEAEVTVDFDIGVITGSFDQATGALSLSGEAGGTLTSNGPEYDGEECTVEVPETLTLTTAGSSGGTNPRSGTPFTAGLAGSGAIAGTWDHMDAIPIEPGNIENVDFAPTSSLRSAGMEASGSSRKSRPRRRRRRTRRKGTTTRHRLSLSCASSRNSPARPWAGRRSC